MLAVKHSGMSCANNSPKFPDKIYTPYYLNYNTEELIDSLYLTKENRKVA